MSDSATESINLVTIGDSGVGKSWLLLRFSNENHKFHKTNTSMPTIGIDFKMKHIELDGKSVKLQIWDTAGQERFRTITAGYYRKAQGILLVYDITDRPTYTNIEKWMDHIHQSAEANVNKILVGNKCDLTNQRVISFEEGEALALKFKIPFIETSAFENINVDEAFRRLASDVKARLDNPVKPDGPTPKPTPIRLVDIAKPVEKKKGCC